MQRWDVRLKSDENERVINRLQPCGCWADFFETDARCFAARCFNERYEARLDPDDLIAVRCDHDRRDLPTEVQ